MKPLVSIVTPTHGRDDLLLSRCLPSVKKQTYGRIEHVVVSDQNPSLYAQLKHLNGVRHVEVNDLWQNEVSERSPGAFKWWLGTQLAFGEYVGFLGDDDEFLPDHAMKHVAAMELEGADYSISMVGFYVDGEHVMDIGDGQVKLTHLDGNGVMCQRSALKKANWTADGNQATDYLMVAKWHRAGLKGTFIPEVTVKHHDGWLKDNSQVVEAIKVGREWRAPANV